MLKNYNINKVNGITTIVFSQVPTIDEGKEIIDILAVESSYHLRMFDFSNILFDWDTGEIAEIAQYSKEKLLEDNRVAFVAPQDLAFGMSRVLEVYRDQEKLSLVGVFRNRQDAEEWLEQQRGSLSIT